MRPSTASNFFAGTNLISFDPAKMIQTLVESNNGDPTMVKCQNIVKCELYTCIADIRCVPNFSECKIYVASFGTVMMSNKRVIKLSEST